MPMSKDGAIRQKRGRLNALKTIQMATYDALWIAIRFWRNVNMDPGQGPKGDCWTWTAYRNPGGYGVFSIARELIPAHCEAYILKNGCLSKGQNVLHSCDFRPCVRVSHLWKGTQRQNILDMERKGRGRHPFGRDQGLAKLDDDKVKRIRQRLSAGETGAALAREFSVSGHVISLVKHRKTWRHVP